MVMLFIFLCFIWCVYFGWLVFVLIVMLRLMVFSDVVMNWFIFGVCLGMKVGVCRCMVLLLLLILLSRWCVCLRL